MYYGYYRYSDGYNITRDSSMIFPELKGGELSSAPPPVNSDIIWFSMEYTTIKYQRIYKLDANNIVDEIKW